MRSRLRSARTSAEWIAPFTGPQRSTARSTADRTAAGSVRSACAYIAWPPDASTSLSAPARRSGGLRPMSSTRPRARAAMRFATSNPTPCAPPAMTYTPQGLKGLNAASERAAGPTRCTSRMPLRSAISARPPSAGSAATAAARAASCPAMSAGKSIVATAKPGSSRPATLARPTVAAYQGRGASSSGETACTPRVTSFRTRFALDRRV